jgi:putative endonuclease
MIRPAKPRARPADPQRHRIAAFRLGLSAESRAAMLLMAKGYRIAARRFKTPFGEIDIVARRRNALIFVEVKARDTAELWLAHHPADTQRLIRFDVILVTPGKMPRHLPNAFDASR